MSQWWTQFEADVNDVVWTRAEPLVMLTRLRRVLHTHYGTDPIPHAELAQLMLWMYTKGCSDYDQELKQEVLCSTDRQLTEAEQELFTTRIHQATQRLPNLRTNWRDDTLQRFMELTGVTKE